MNEYIVSGALLRQFLLGKVDDKERQRIESLFVTDARSRERILAAEEDFIEDYLEDCLKPVDRENFLSRYGDTLEKQRKLRIARSIKEWAIKEGAVVNTPVTAAPFSPLAIWNRLRAPLQMQPVFVTPIATAMIAIVVICVWLSGKMEQRNRHLAIEQELARLNSPSNLRETVPHTLLLTPVSVRSAAGQAELKLRSDMQQIELRFLWIRKERYPVYRALVRRESDGELFTLDNLQAENAGGYAIRIKLPVHILTRGFYRVEVSGVAADGTVDLSEESSFIVSS